MASSLQEQLLKAGLVSQQKARQTRTEKHKGSKARGGAPDAEAQERRRRAEQARAEKAERDRALNREREEAARQTALANELRQLIHAHRITRDRAEIAFNFADGKALKRIYVTPEQQRALASGRLALVRQDHFYELIPAEVADRVRARNPGLILVQNPVQERAQSAGHAGADPSTDDPYAGYEVPDDLMW